MRKLILVLACFASLCMYAENKTIVNVRFQNAKNESVYVYAPINNQRYFPTDTIHQIKNDSVYQFRLNINRASFFNIIIKDQEVISMILQPGDHSTLVYDFNRKCPYSFTGSNAPGQQLLTEWTQQTDPYKYEWIRDYTKAPLDTIPEKMEANFRKIEKQDIARFDSLYSLKKIDQTFYNFMVTDIRLYYLSTLSRIARAGSEQAQKDIYYQYWSQLYKQHPVEKMETGSLWFQNYAELYIEDYWRAKKEREGQAIKRPADTKEFFQLIYRLYNEWTPKKELQEITLGHQLLNLAINNKTSSMDIIPLFNDFKNRFPKNPICPVLDNFTRNLLIIQEKIQKDFSPGVKFVDKREELKTLKDVFDRFKGKPLFIDFWFSTCGPCREEFQYAKPLEEFLQKNGVELLYISIDNDRVDDNWKNSIKLFDLLGWHIRVPHEVHVDMDEKYGIHYYPTYMLVDKEGNVLLKNAKKPSEKDELYQQISNALKLNSQ